MNDALHRFKSKLKQKGDDELLRIWKQRDDAQKMKLLEDAGGIFEYDQFLESDSSENEHESKVNTSQALHKIQSKHRDLIINQNSKLG